MVIKNINFHDKHFIIGHGLVSKKTRGLIKTADVLVAKYNFAFIQLLCTVMMHNIKKNHLQKH